MHERIFLEEYRGEDDAESDKKREDPPQKRGENGEDSPPRNGEDDAKKTGENWEDFRKKGKMVRIAENPPHPAPYTDWIHACSTHGAEAA